MAQIIQTAADIDAADKLELRAFDLEAQEMRKYPSMVQDVTDEGIYVTMPAEGHVTVPIQEGASVGVSIWKGYAAHRFKSQVLKRVRGRIPQLILSKPGPGEISRMPRRRFFRAETGIPAKVSVLNADREEPLEGMILDLSAGGCRLQTSERIGAEVPLALDFDLPFPPDKDGVNRTRPMRQIPGKVRWSISSSAPEESSEAGKRIGIQGIEFGEMDNAVVHSALLSYVALRQRELIRQIADSGSGGGSRGGGRDLSQDRTMLREAKENLKQTEEQIRKLGEGEKPVEPTGPETAEEAVEAGEQAERAQNDVATKEERSEPSGLSPQGGLKGKTVLIVDHEEEMRNILAETLMYEGYRVLEAGNGQEGLKVARRIHVDLVITALKLPDTDGWRLLVSLGEHKLDIPVVFITDYLCNEIQDILTHKDIAGFLVKPIKLDELVQMVDRILFPEYPNRNQRILVVDDEEDIRLLVSAQLQEAGFEVETAVDGRDALVKVNSFEPHLILLDIIMPRLNGFEVCQHLRSRRGTADIPILMLTAKTSPLYVHKAVFMKVNGYIVKPFDPENLIARIHRVLQRPQAR